MRYLSFDTAARLAAFLLILCGPSAFGATLFVSATGNDANPCDNPGTPCSTIQAAVNKSANGDTIVIGPGAFSGTVSIDDRAKLRIIGSGPSTIITHPGPAGPNVAVFAINNSRLIEISDIRLTGHASSDGFRVFYSTSVTFNRCIVDNNGGPGGGFFLASSLGVMINDSTIEDNGTGIRVDGSTEASLNSAPFSAGTSIVQRNGIGVIVRSGNFFWHGGGIIQDNGTGINGNGGTIKFCCGDGNTRKLINNNQGIVMLLSSNADMRGPLEISGNRVFGIRQFGGLIRLSDRILIRGNGNVNSSAIRVESGNLQLNGFEQDDIQIVDNPGHGLFLTDNASARIFNTSIKRNGNHGLRLQALSTAFLAGEVLIQSNGEKDLSCTPNSFARGDNSGVDTQFCPGFDNSPDP